MPHVDIELEDNKQFISNIPRMQDLNCKLSESPNFVDYHINRMYLDRQAQANSVDPDEMLLNAASHQCSLFAPHPAIFRHNIR